MIKKVLLVGLLTIAFGMPALKAQDCIRENKERAVYLGQNSSDNMSTQMKTDAGKFSIGIQIPHNVMFTAPKSLKMGIGARFTYDFTKILRISIDADYYLLKPDGYFNAYIGMYHFLTKINDLGEQWDANFNFNFVFGERDFHIYFLLGGGLTYFVGYDDWNYSVDKSFLGMVNLGLGIEYQLNEKFRLYYEPALTVSIGSLSNYKQGYMCKLGLSYCF